MCCNLDSTHYITLPEAANLFAELCSVEPTFGTQRSEHIDIFPGQYSNEHSLSMTTDLWYSQFELAIISFHNAYN